MASADKREFEKYLKFFTLKVIQVIVQSRKGDILKTSSRSSATDWFGLALPDDKSVQAELKRSTPARMPQEGTPLCVEISLKSTEDDDSSIVLENWVLSIDERKTDPSAHSTASMYPKMGQLLKSLLCITRLLPAFLLSRQVDDCWNICYRIFPGSPDVSSLGASPEKVPIGHCLSAHGRVAVGVDYRTAINTFRRMEESCDEFVDFVPRHSDSSLGTVGMQKPPAAFSGQGLFNDEEVESIVLHQFSQVMKFEKQTSLAPSLTPSLTPQVSASPDMSSVRRTSPSSRALHEDFVHLNSTGVVSTKPAFAPDSVPSNSISEFFEECRNPPILDLFAGGSVLDINAAMKEDLSL